MNGWIDYCFKCIVNKTSVVLNFISDLKEIETVAYTRVKDQANHGEALWRNGHMLFETFVKY